MAARLVFMAFTSLWQISMPRQASFIATASNSSRSKATIPPRAYAARFAVHFTQHIVAVEDKVW